MNDDLIRALEALKDEAVRDVSRVLSVFMRSVWDVEDCAFALKKSASRIRHMVSDGVLPHYKQNGTVYFKREEIESWQLKNRMSSNDELRAKAATHCVLNRMR